MLPHELGRPVEDRKALLVGGIPAPLVAQRRAKLLCLRERDELV